MIQAIVSVTIEDDEVFLTHGVPGVHAEEMADALRVVADYLVEADTEADMPAVVIH